MAVRIPSALKLSQLKSLAFHCGISSSGTKAVLTSRLEDELSLCASAEGEVGDGTSKPTRILSIDMGIRNLAYSVLELRAGTQTTNLASTKPSLMAWRRFAVSTAPESRSPDPKTEMVLRNALTDGPDAKEIFTPLHMSSLAYNLLANTLLPHEPTHVLIERQRFRSMGSRHILEWTVRVNMLESMLYAVLHTLNATGRLDVKIIPIAPGKVGPFYLQGIEGSERNKSPKGTAKNVKAQNKAAKIDLVRSWLERGDKLTLGTQHVKDTAGAYLKEWHRVPGTRKRLTLDATDKMTKLDDLADCLMQGVAWIQWEENKKLVLKHGVESLQLDQLGKDPFHTG